MTNLLFAANMTEPLSAVHSASLAALPLTSHGERDLSPFNPAYQTGNPGSAKLHTGVLNCILGIASRDITIVKVADDTFAAETAVRDSAGQPADGEYVLVRASKNGEFNACRATLSAGGKIITQALPQLGTRELKALPYEVLYVGPLAFACSAYADLRADLLGAVGYLRDGSASGVTEDDMTHSLYRLCDAARNIIATGAYKPQTPGGNINRIAPLSLSLGSCRGDVVLDGHDPQVLFGAVLETAGARYPATMGEAMKEFAAYRQAHSAYGPWERKMIPVFAEDFPVPLESVKMARRYVQTKGMKRPVVNIMWRGITAYGKSTGVECLAAMLGMPLVRVTCSSTMETQDFLAAFVPATGEGDQPALPDLPSYDELFYDSASAYTALTGQVKENVTGEEVLAAYTAEVTKRARGSQGPRFQLVESNFIQALERGWLCEVQEVSSIRDPGVVVGLNEYDRPGAIIPLVNGRKAVRSPDALVVYTDNVGYASRRPLDQSVIRRMAFVLDSYELPKSQVLARIRFQFDFSDDRLLEQMYEAWQDTAEFCRVHDITDGSCSVAELESWVQMVQCDGTDCLKEDFDECVIGKATSDPDEQDRIRANAQAKFSLFSQ